MRVHCIQECSFRNINTGTLAIHLSCQCWWIAQPFFCSRARSLGLDPDSEAAAAFALAALAWGQSLALWPVPPQYIQRFLEMWFWCSWEVSFPFESSLPASFDSLAGMDPVLSDLVSAGLLSMERGWFVSREDDDDVTGCCWDFCWGCLWACSWVCSCCHSQYQASAFLAFCHNSDRVRGFPSPLVMSSLSLEGNPS